MAVEDNARLHGITPSTVLRVYTRRTRREACQKYFDLNGVEKTEEELLQEKQEKEKLRPRKCENCREENPYGRQYCRKCLRPIDPGALMELEMAREQKVREMIEVLKQELLGEVLSKMKG